MNKINLVDPVFKTIGLIADRLNLECYVVGGYVRDLLLGRQNHDIDVVVVGNGISIGSAFAQTVMGKLEVFQRYGTAHVSYGDGKEVEFVGARKESYSPDSRNPNCTVGTLKDDQERRDFTINALAICLNQSRFGELIDPFDGVGDLKKGVLDTPLDPLQTFSDDPLRMLRAVRFAVKLGFNITDRTYEGIKNSAPRITIISQERITEELNKILISPDPKRGIVLLRDLGLLQFIIPELTALDETGLGHKNNFWHSINVLDQVKDRSENLWLRWAALLHDIGKKPCEKFSPETGWTFYDHDHYGARMIPNLFRRLKLPLGNEMKYVQLLVDMHMRPSMISTKVITDSAVRRLVHDAGPWIDDLKILCECDLTTQNQEKRQRIGEHFTKLWAMVDDLKVRDQIRLFQPVIKGEEIMAITGLGQGAEVGVLKKILKDAVLDGIVENEVGPLTDLLVRKAKELGLMK